MGAAVLLTISRNGETIKTCPLEGEGEIVLGRAEGCVIRLDDRAISRQHAAFRLVDGGVQVERKSEFAPLVVNGADQTRAMVREADVISIGPYLVKVSVGKAAAQQAPVAAPAPVAVAPAPLSTETVALSALPEDPAQEVQLPSLEQPDAQASDAPSEPAGVDDPLPGFEPVELQADPPASGTSSVPDLNLELGGSAVAMSQPAELAIDSADLGMGVGAPPPDEPVEHAEDDAKTKLTPQGKVEVRLVFSPGDANVTEFELKQDEVSIGRGKNCDIVLNDKKSSRKNTIIRRAGMSFTIKDLDSANGTYVNGVRVREQELYGDDLIKVGGVEFRFKAMSADYSARAAGFMPVPQDPEPQDLAGDPGVPDLGLSVGDQMGGMSPMAAAAADSQGLAGFVPAPATSGAPGAAGIAGITGIGPADVKQMSLMEKLRNFKDLPRKQQIMLVIIFGGIGYFLLDDDEVPQASKPKPKPSAVVQKADRGPLTFAQLSPEQQRFVEAQYNLGFDYFKSKEYDKSIYELEKIFGLVQDYKDARMVQNYAKEGKRRLEAFEEEKRRKEEEARLKAKIQALVEECKERMAKKQYEQARELFTQISVLDPDNSQVATWKKELEQYEEDKRAAEQTRMVQAEINKRAWEVYGEGIALKKQGRYHSAIETFGKVGDIGASDPKPIALAAKQIGVCKAAIRATRDPVLAEAKTAETAQDFSKAFALYKKATRIDPPHPEGYRGMDRIRGVLHERAKLVYTEAVLAESFSDFATAEKKFKECLDVAPTDDIYHERAERKLKRYFKKREEAPQ